MGKCSTPSLRPEFLERPTQILGKPPAGRKESQGKRRIIAGTKEFQKKVGGRGKGSDGARVAKGGKKTPQKKKKEKKKKPKQKKNPPPTPPAPPKKTPKQKKKLQKKKNKKKKNRQKKAPHGYSPVVEPEQLRGMPKKLPRSNNKRIFARSNKLPRRREVSRPSEERVLEKGESPPSWKWGSLPLS